MAVPWSDIVAGLYMLNISCGRPVTGALSVLLATTQTVAAPTTKLASQALFLAEAEVSAGRELGSGVELATAAVSNADVFKAVF